MHRLRRCARYDGERAAVAGEPRTVGAFVLQAKPCVRSDRLVELLRRGAVRHPDGDVIEHALDYARGRTRGCDPEEVVARGRRSVAPICDAGSVPGPRPAVATTAFALAGALALAGCGGNGRLSHGDLVQRANAVCSAYRASAEKVARPRTYDEIVAYVGKTLPLYEAARRKLAALKPPAKDAPAFRSWLAADSRISAALADLGRAAMRRDFPAVTAAAGRVQAEGVASRHAAQTLGATTCAQP